MRLLVTGGAGFIGSHFIGSFLSENPDAEAVNVDSLTYASIFKPDFERQFGRRYSFLRADIIDSEKMAAACRDADLVINFAAETHVDNSIADPLRFARTNVLGTAALLDSALRAGHKRFFQISTDEVYGSSGGRAFAEADPLNPSSPYSASKASADLLALAYGRTYGISLTISRSSNNYGPRQHPEKFIPRMITRLSRGMKIPVYGNGQNIRDWLYVEDNCAALRLLLEKGQSGIFNIASGISARNIELAKMVASACGKGESELEFVPDRKGHDFCYSVDTAKIRSLGWAPKISLADGLGRTIKWYLENKPAWSGRVN